jgi:hypothetical protein
MRQSQMRQSQGSMLQDPLVDSTDQGTDQGKQTKRDKVCFISIWLLTNVITFMTGYYVKAVPICDSIKDDGSL